jgi:hypothetical protein
MKPLPFSRAHRWATAVVAGGLLGVGFLPLFGGPGYEQALASGLLVPSVAALATSFDLRSGEPPAPLACVGRGISSGLALAAVAFATALIHGLRAGFCDFLGAALGFVLTAGFGAALGGLWGAVVAEVSRARGLHRTATASLALLAPALGVAVSLARFYTSPMVFAFDPFFGYFGGTLYDTVVDAGTPLLTYRAGSVATLVSAALAASVLRRDPSGLLRVVRLRGDGWALARATSALLACGMSLAITSYGPELDHWQTSASIARRLGGARAGARCDVVLPESTLPEDAALIVKDCDEELAAIEADLGSNVTGRVRAFFFRDAREKKLLMGAGETYIAKPWRNEVYLQLGGYPHPILGHELAHVVAGSFGRGPFQIAGPFGGLWPNPGLIEGVASAASPDDDALTDLEWVHAMSDLGILPAVERVFSLDFLGAPAAKAYTIAGAFVRWVVQRFGAATVRAWYRGASIEELTGETWRALDLAFRSDAAKTPLSTEATAYAKARFERAAIFGRKCPHVVDGIRQHADQCRDSREVALAVELYGEVLARDPHDWAAHFGRGVTELRMGRQESGRDELRAIADDPGAPPPWRDRSLDVLSDDALFHGDEAKAAASYRAIADRSVDEDYARMEEVKSLCAADPAARTAMEALLTGTPSRGTDSVVAASLLGAWEERTGSPLAAFLLGKNLSQRGWRALGAAHLDKAIASGTYPSARVGREVIRDRAIDACAMGDRARVAAMRELVLDPAGPYASSGGRKSAVLRLLERCTTDATRQPPSNSGGPSR